MFYKCQNTVLYSPFLIKLVDFSVDLLLWVSFFGCKFATRNSNYETHSAQNENWIEQS